MSLITQMLKDIDKRQAAAGEEQPVFADVRLSSHVRRNSYGPTLLLVLVVGVAGVWTLVWSQRHNPAPKPVDALATANAVPDVVPAAPLAPTQHPPVLAPRSVSAEADKPSGPPAGDRKQAQPEDRSVRKEEVVARVATAVPERKTSRTEPAVAQPASIAMISEKLPQDVAKASRQDKSVPESNGGQVSSFKVVSSQQRSDNFYRQSILLLQQSRVTEAKEALRQALAANSVNHPARQFLAGLLADTGHNAEATALLRDGLILAPGNSGFSMALARLQVADDSREAALATLEQGLASAGDDAEYHAFLAALLQSQERHGEAAQHYIVALRSNPTMPNWLVGVGISFKATNKMADATEAFQRAMDTGELSGDVARFVEQQLKAMQQPR